MRKALVAAPLLAVMMNPAAAQDALVSFKVMSPETALEAAQASLTACREMGFQVSVSIVDRFGTPQVLLRDRFAGVHTPDTARRKAWTAVSFRASTQEMAAVTQPGLPQSAARDITGALMLGGGIVVEAAGSIIGGIGVSGAPGGEQDEACAVVGRDAVLSSIEF